MDSEGHEPGYGRADGEDLLLSVRLTPRSAKEGFGGLWRDEKGAAWLQAQVRAVPEKGRANKALIALLAKRLAIPARDIRLESGDTSRLKRFRLLGHATGAGEIRERLDGL